MRELCALLHSAHPLSRRDEHRVQKLATAIEKYEDEHHTMPEPTDSALLTHLMGATKVSVRTLSRQTKIPVAEINAILSGVRRIGRTEANALSAYFCVEPDTFSRDQHPLMFFGSVVKAGLVASIGRFQVGLSSLSETKGDEQANVTYRPWKQQGHARSGSAQLKSRAAYV